MKQKNGIICLETEWEHTIERNRRSIHTKPLLDFLEKSSGCEIIYRRVATKNELQYYLKRFNLAKYDNYSIIYLSFHGDTHPIFLEGEKGDEAVLNLSDLAHLSDGVFKDRFVHFSSCRTLLGSEKELENFKTETGAKSISGYTKSVDGILSAINDIAYFDRIFNYGTMKGLESAMDKLYSGLNDELGFKIY